ncbi:hypothetical protein ARAM_000533 [Aspergillus rambellii]|uniref:Uncharacterized protein n=1 Tax=Aspergillus rambellii TaxID=308745 RepID=A0A0F8WFM1_9EURO|nr:hypothetical protein ARAM_000533 [Aspergillus rambellii]
MCDPESVQCYDTADTVMEKTMQLATSYSFNYGKLRVDLFKDNSPTDGRAYWPKRELLPETTDIWLGWIIEGCWDGRFQTAHCVLQALDNVRLPPVGQSHIIRLGQAIKNSIKGHPLMTIIGVVGLTLLLGRRVLSQFRGL